MYHMLIYFFFFNVHNFSSFSDILRQMLPSLSPLFRKWDQQCLWETHMESSVFGAHLVTLALYFTNNVGFGTNLMILMGNDFCLYRESKWWIIVLFLPLFNPLFTLPQPTCLPYPTWNWRQPFLAFLLFLIFLSLVGEDRRRRRNRRSLVQNMQFPL